MINSLWLKSTFVLLCLLLTADPVYAQRSTEVVPLSPPKAVQDDGKVEILEFFAYGCIHCANLEPKLEEWKKRQPPDVKLQRVPAAFAIRGIDSIAIYYTLEGLGVLDKLHQKVFDAVNAENQNLGNPATLNKWLEKHGVDPKKYEEMQKSFSVQSRIRRARAMTQEYKVESTPMLIVAGRSSVIQTGGAERLFETVERLINEARGKTRPAGAKS